MGANAGDALTDGEDNVSLGYNALGAETSGDGNVALGWSTLPVQNGANYNIAIGHQAGKVNATGATHIFVGRDTGLLTTAADNLTFIGDQAGNAANYSGRNLVALGYDAQPSAAGANDEVTLGSSGVATLRCAVNTITLISDERDKTDIQVIDYGLDLIEYLRPRKFTCNSRNGG